MARKGGRGIGLGPMGLIVSIVVGLVILIALYSFVPTIGYQIRSAGNIPTSSWWYYENSSTNASQFFISTSGLPVLAVLAIILGAAIYYFMGI